MCTRFFTITIVACALCACGLISGNNETTSTDGSDGKTRGVLSLKFVLPENAPSTKGAENGVQIDTNDFHLTVTAADGQTIYDGSYGNAPDGFDLDAGSYLIRVESEKFTGPDFDSPRWGDEVLVSVRDGAGILVELQCRQLNCGVRMTVDGGFLTEYPSSSLLLSSQGKSLLYSYSEKRTAFFLPGEISLVLSTGANDETLLTRTLEEGEILCLDIRCSKASESESRGTGIGIQIDTSCTYLPEIFYLGDGGTDSRGSSPQHAFTISQAKANVGLKNVWVGGYIVGGDLSSKSMSFTPPFSSATNLVIGPRAASTSRTSCMSVQLPSGNIREDMNLVTHPGNLGRYVLIKGDIEASYFGLPGVKNLTEYQFK